MKNPTPQTFILHPNGVIRRPSPKQLAMTKFDELLLVKTKPCCTGKANKKAYRFERRSPEVIGPA